MKQQRGSFPIYYGDLLSLCFMAKRMRKCLFPHLFFSLSIPIAVSLTVFQ